MKMFKRLSLILLLPVMCAGKLYAQQDYFVTTNNDTVRCHIKNIFDKSFFSKAVLIFKEDNGKSYQVPLDSVKAFFDASDTSTYVLRYLPPKNTRAYVKWLERGKVDLYEEKVAATTYGDDIDRYWYIGKGTDPLVQIKTDSPHNNIGSRKDRMKALLSRITDCPAVVTELKYTDLNKNYDFDVIRDLIKIYNAQCGSK